MEHLDGLTELAIVIGAGVVAAFVANKLKLPSILGYLVAGVVLSLVLPREILQSSWLGNFAQLGAALLLFAIGVEFSLSSLTKVKFLVVAGALIQAAITVIVGLAFLPGLFGINVYTAFLISALFSTSSTALVVKILEARGEMYSHTSNIIIGWLIVQDLMIVGWFLLFQTFAPNSQVGEPDLIGAIAKTAIVIVACLGAGKYILPPLMRRVADAKSSELLIVSTVAVIVAFSLLANYLGISFTIGAFLAGLALSESFLNHEIFTEIKPIRNLFMMVFFVSVGSIFNINTLFDKFAIILFSIVVILIIKVIAIVTICVWFNVHIKNSLKVGLSLFQVGEFAFLGAQLGLSNGWIDLTTYSLIVAVTVISMAFTPVMLGLTDEIYTYLEYKIKQVSPNLYRGLFINTPIAKDRNTAELHDHVIVCGHGRVGKYVSSALAKTNLPFVVIEYEAEIAEQLSKQGINVIFGDATNSDILISAGVENARVLVAALPGSYDVNELVRKAKELNPHIKLLARSHEEYAALELVDISIEPEMEAANKIVANLYKLLRIKPLS